MKQNLKLHETVAHAWAITYISDDKEIKKTVIGNSLYEISEIMGLEIISATYLDAALPIICNPTHALGAWKITTFSNSTYITAAPDLKTVIHSLGSIIKSAELLGSGMYYPPHSAELVNEPSSDTT